MPLIHNAPNQDSGRDYKYFSTEGVPFYGKAPLMTSDEYVTRTTQIGFAGYGVFDVSNPEQEHFGRTLKQILEKSRTGEFELLSLNEYNNGVVNSPSEPPAIFVFAMWVEKADTTHEMARQYAQQ